MTKLKTGAKLLPTMEAAEVMSSPVLTVNMWSSIHEVAKIFIENNISGAPVVDMEGIPIGVITKTDLARYDQERANLLIVERDKKIPAAKETSENMDRKGFHLEPEEATIEHWMTPFIFDVHPHTKLGDITKKMMKYGFHHVFVTDKKTKIVEGVITTFDLLKLMNRHLNGVPEGEIA